MSEAALKRRVWLGKQRQRLEVVAQNLKPIKLPERDIVQVIHEQVCRRCASTDGYTLWSACPIWAGLRVAYAEGKRLAWTGGRP